MDLSPCSLWSNRFCRVICLGVCFKNTFVVVKSRKYSSGGLSLAGLSVSVGGPPVYLVFPLPCPGFCHMPWRWCPMSAKGPNRVPPCPRCSEGLPRPSAGSLPGGHLQISHHLPGLPDDEEARAAGGGFRVRQAAQEHHLAQLQLHGAAAAVRVSGAHHILRRRGC